MLINEKHLAVLNSPVQEIDARVELHNGSTLVQICTCQDYLSNFTIERVGEEKFFGYGICHKITVHLIDPNRELNLTDIDFMEITFGVDGDFIYPFPIFYIDEVKRDEVTNNLIIIGWDALYNAVNYKVSDLALPAQYSIYDFATACATLLGMPLKIIGIEEGSFNPFNTFYSTPANFEGTENLRLALNAIAEATQTIYYMSGDWELTFKRLDQLGEPLLTIDNNLYIDLTSGDNLALGAIMHVTELGDNVYSGDLERGATQYVRNNPFWELREDIQNLLDEADYAMSHMYIHPFECNWLGNYLLEIGDKISFIGNNNSSIDTFLVDDFITFDGTLGQASRWAFSSDEVETAENPTSLGDALNKTVAIVDKVNKQITLFVGENDKKFSEIQQNVNDVSITVTEVEELVDSNNTRIGALETSSEEITAKVSSLEKTTSGHTERIGSLEVSTEDITARVESAEATLEGTAEVISQLQIDTSGIAATVSSTKEELQSEIEKTNSEIETLTKEVSLKMSEEAVSIQITQKLEEGVDKVAITDTGYSFDAEGLKITKSDSSTHTIITDEGMTVYDAQHGSEVLVANKAGVQAVNLKATTYLIIGDKSRFETQGERTACFWIGG